MKVTARYAVFAPHHTANAWLALGWMPDPAFERCYHGQFSVLCIWICACEMRRPDCAKKHAGTIKDIHKGERPSSRAIAALPPGERELQIEHQRDHEDNREGGRYGEGFW